MKHYFTIKYSAVKSTTEYTKLHSKVYLSKTTKVLALKYT